MRPAALALSCVALAACGDVGTAERLSSKETLDGVDVPTIGTVGDFPDPAHRHVVNVTSDGRIVIEGVDGQLDGLAATLESWGAMSSLWFNVLGHPIAGPGRETGTNPDCRCSGEHVLFRIDGDVSWAAAERVVATALDARIIRIWFVVRHEGDGLEGAIGFPTTLHGGGLDMGGSIRVGLPTVMATVAQDASDGSPQRLFEVLRAIGKAKAGKFEAYLDVDRSLPTRTWLSLLDACVRAKPAGLRPWSRFDRSPEPFASLAARRVEGHPTYSIKLFGLDVPTDVDTTPMPAVARIRGPAATFEGWNYEPFNGPTTVVTKPLTK